MLSEHNCKIIFVCRGNVGRSQMAAALFTKYSGIKAYSAGTKVLDNEKKLSDIPLAEPVIRFMAEEGIDVAGNTKTQLTEEMVHGFDKIIVMAEPETIPEYLRENNKVEFWDIEDPKGMNDTGYRKIITQIKFQVLRLISSL